MIVVIILSHNYTHKFPSLVVKQMVFNTSKYGCKLWNVYSELTQWAHQKNISFLVEGNITHRLTRN